MANEACGKSYDCYRHEDITVLVMLWNLLLDKIVYLQDTIILDKSVHKFIEDNLRHFKFSKALQYAQYSSILMRKITYSFYDLIHLVK
jgi:hypothetical protein